MNPTSVYSKSGKGVQEAAGKTSLLSRPDRAVLAAIDGRASLADVAQRIGRAFDNGFRQLISQLDKDGFIREVSAGSAAGAAPKPAVARPAPKPSAPTAPMDPASDLDFTVTMRVDKKSAPLPPPQQPPRAPAPPPKPANVPPPPPPPSAEDKVKAERIAKDQQAAMAKAREEAERKVAEERERVKAAAEAKARAEAEEKARTDSAAQAHAAREAAVREAVRAAAETRTRAETEVLRREQEELKRRLEEERGAREEIERKVKEETERVRRELEEERRKLEQERRQHDEEKRREEAERAMRRAREEEEERARRRQREEENAAEEIRRMLQAKQSGEAKPEQKKVEETRPAEPVMPPPAKTGDAFADSLLADLAAFNTREEDEARKSQAEAEERSARQAAARRDEEARQAKEQAARQNMEDKSRQKEEKERRLHEEQEQAAQAEREAGERIAREEERRKQEEEERKRKAKDEERLASRASQTSDAYASSVEQKRRKEAQLFSTGRARDERKKSGWGKTAALILTLALLIGLAVLHVMPISTAEYERAASQALGRPVKIGSGNFSLFSGIQLKFDNVAVGDARVGRVRAFPELGTVLSDRKAFSRIELEGLSIPQESVGEALFARIRTDNFYVARVVAREFKLDGPLPLPRMEGELVFGPDGAVRAATLRGADGLVAKLVPKGGEVEFDLTANRFTLPFAQEITLSQFGMKGSATRSAMNIAAWDGQLYSGTLSGTARLRWGGTWNLEGVITARGVNAAVFAPALLSDGRAEGTGRFFMSGAEPAKLGRAGRLEGSFTVSKGVLGSFDLSRAIQTGGKQSTGRTQFAEMNGQGVYDRGAVALRNLTIGAGALNAGASADIAQSGALSGRIVADVKTASQTQRATLLLGGTVKEPQVKN